MFAHQVVAGHIEIVSAGAHHVVEGVGAEIGVEVDVEEDQVLVR